MNDLVNSIKTKAEAHMSDTASPFELQPFTLDMFVHDVFQLADQVETLQDALNRIIQLETADGTEESILMTAMNIAQTALDEIQERD